MGDTARALGNMTDEGKFEKLAAAVLRRVNPKYNGLIDVGTNVNDKTVKSPIDGISVVPGSKPPEYIAVHHHTTDQPTRLRQKWLHNGKTRTGKKSKAPPGDIPKTVQWIDEERARTPDALLTFVLTTNQIPDQKLIRDAQFVCRNANIKVDVWDCSRLADFLDIDPDGQWLRQKYLGITQERLSIQLLKDIANRSLVAFAQQLFSFDDRS